MGSDESTWDGLEVRLLYLSAAYLNFTVEFTQPRASKLRYTDTMHLYDYSQLNYSLSWTIFFCRAAPSRRSRTMCWWERHHQQWVAFTRRQNFPNPSTPPFSSLRTVRPSFRSLLLPYLSAPLDCEIDKMIVFFTDFILKCTHILNRLKYRIYKM